MKKIEGLKKVFAGYYNYKGMTIKKNHVTGLWKIEQIDMVCSTLENACKWVDNLKVYNTDTKVAVFGNGSGMVNVYRYGLYVDSFKSLYEAENYINNLQKNMQTESEETPAEEPKAEKKSLAKIFKDNGIPYEASGCNLKVDGIGVYKQYSRHGRVQFCKKEYWSDGSEHWATMTEENIMEEVVAYWHQIHDGEYNK